VCEAARAAYLWRNRNGRQDRAVYLNHDCNIGANLLTCPEPLQVTYTNAIKCISTLMTERAAKRMGKLRDLVEGGIDVVGRREVLQ
jgi:hypothetical protein